MTKRPAKRKASDPTLQYVDLLATFKPILNIVLHVQMPDTFGTAPFTIFIVVLLIFQCLAHHQTIFYIFRYMFHCP